MDGIGNVAGWRWIFILEGILTVVMACVGFFTIVDFPQAASFLTEEERTWVVHGLKYQGSKGSRRMIEEREHFGWNDVTNVFTDWQTYVASFSKCTRGLLYSLGTSVVY